MKRLSCVALFALLATATPAPAAVITTTLGAGLPTTGVMFDVQIGSLPLILDGFDLRVDEDADFFMDFYMRFGGHTTNQSVWEDPAEWSVASRLSPSPSVAGGGDVRQFTLPSSVTLSAGGTYGFYLHSTDALGTGGGSFLARSQAFSTGDEFVSNSDLSVLIGLAQDINVGQEAFAADSFEQNQLFHGSIHYTVVPEPGSLVALGVVGAGFAWRRRCRRRREAVAAA